VKLPADAVAAVERLLDRCWHLCVAGDTSWWPYRFPLGRPTRDNMTHQFGQVQQWAFSWQEWADSHSLTLEWEGRRSGASHDQLPSYLLVPDVDAAASLSVSWPQRLARGRRRHAALAARFPGAPIAGVVRAVDTWTDVDVALLAEAADWFQTHPASGVSPRQVPVEGLHSKWLAGHGSQVLAITGLGSLGLVEPRSTPVHFTYLDPAHRAAGGRRHDSVVPGDSVQPAYLPQLVLICENKDSAIMFPDRPAAIAVQGGGKAGPAFIPAIEWIAAAEDVVYWGDLDAAGFEILNAYRQAGMQIRTILMDLPTLTEYRQFAATTDTKGRVLGREPRKDLPLLTSAEREAYNAVTDTDGDWPVRVEQERIPLKTAARALGVPVPRRGPIDASPVEGA